MPNSKAKISEPKLVSRYFALLSVENVELCYDAIGPLIDLSQITEFSVLGKDARFFRAAKIASALADHGISHSTEEVYGIIARRLNVRQIGDPLLCKASLLSALVARGAPITIYSQVQSEEVWRRIIAFTVYHYVGRRINPESIRNPEDWYFRNIRYRWINRDITLLSARGSSSGSIIPFDDHIEKFAGHEEVDASVLLQISHDFDIVDATSLAIENAIKDDAKLSMGLTGAQPDQVVPLGRKDVKKFPEQLLYMILGAVVTGVVTLPINLYEKRVTENAKSHSNLTIDFEDPIPDTVSIFVNGKFRRDVPPDSNRSVVVEDVGSGNVDIRFEVRGLSPVNCRVKFDVGKEKVLRVDTFEWDELAAEGQREKHFEAIPCSFFKPRPQGVSSARPIP